MKKEDVKVGQIFRYYNSNPYFKNTDMGYGAVYRIDCVNNNTVSASFIRNNVLYSILLPSETFSEKGWDECDLAVISGLVAQIAKTRKECSEYKHKLDHLEKEKSKYQQIIKECMQASNAHIEAIESDRKLVSKLLNENKKLKDSISCAADKQEGMLVLLQDDSAHFVENGTDILFDRDNNVICVLNEKVDTLALFDKDFVRGVMLTTMSNNDAIKTKGVKDV